jgi:glyoxylase-like metal-dependent hydrolase (beta-lactamase superfamily II)
MPEGPAAGRAGDFGTGPAPEPGRPDELAPGLVRLTAPNPGLMTGPGTNTYLVGRGQLAVIDPGPLDEGHLDAVQALAARLGGSIAWVLATHHHPDHAPGANALAQRCGAEVLAFEARPSITPDRCIGEGFVLEGPDFSLHALHTPGHASDHLCWRLEGPEVLLSGDHVMHGSTVVIRPPDGDMSAYLDTLGRLLVCDPPLRAIAPGHGRLIDDPRAALEALIEHRLARQDMVAAALAAAGRATVDELLPEVYPDASEEQRPVAGFSLWAHLRRLGFLGRAVSGAGPGADDLDTRWTSTGSPAI